MYDLAFLGDDWGGIVGDHGTLLAYDGVAWKNVKVPESLFRLRAIAYASRKDCVTVGGTGSVLDWNSPQWKRKRLGTPKRPTAVVTTEGEALLGDDHDAPFWRIPATPKGRYRHTSEAP